MKTTALKGITFALALFGLAAASQAVDFHVATAQDLQNALTTAAGNGADNNIYLTNGYYTGDFNFNSAGGHNLIIQAEPGVFNTQIALDGAGTGRDLNLANTATGNFTVQGITFLRNCGDYSIGALRIAGGGGSIILVQNCQFLSPANTSGAGLELDSGLNATITNCVVTGTSGGGGTGISVSGLPGTVNVWNCVVSTNSGGGVVIGVYNISVGISSPAVVNIAGSTFAGNSYVGGVFCWGAATITGNTFTGNSYDYTSGYSQTYGGGGVNCGDGSTLTGNTFTGNTASEGQGGGVYCAGSATLTGNTFTGNSADWGDGGGVSCGDGSTLTGNTFTGNSSYYNDFYGEGGGGGGVYCGGVATITGNTFTGNSSYYSSYYSEGGGGGIYCGGSATFTGNTFTGNSANGSGGGAYCSGGTFIVSSNSFSQNSASAGGGLYVTGPTVTLQDNLLANNSASDGGGLWVDATATLFMINNTIFGNTAAGSGGGAAFEVTGTVELLNVYNNIIWGNTADGNGGDVWLAGTGQQKLFLFNDASSMYGVWDIAQNNIDLSPQFFDPVNGDYHLQSASPCLNAGTNGAPSLPLADLDGNSRTNSAGQVDLGCYEFNTTATHPADVNGDWVISGDEFTAYAAAWKAGQTWSNAPTVIPANYVTRAGYLMTNGPAYHNDGSARPTNWKIGSGP